MGDFDQFKRASEFDQFARADEKPVEGTPGPEVTPVQTAIRSFARDYVPGADYVAGLGGYIEDQFDDKPDRPYSEHVKEQRFISEDGARQNPTTASAAGAAGSIGQAISMPWSKAKGVIGIGKRAGQEAVTAFLTARGKGASTGEALDGAKTTALMGGVGEVGISTGKAVAKGFRAAAEHADVIGGLKAVGARSPDFESMRRKAPGRAELARVAGDLHKEGIITPGAAAETMEDRLAAARDYHGSMLGKTYQDLDAIGAAGSLPNIVQRARGVIADYGSKAGSGNDDLANRVSTELNRIGLLARQQGHGQNVPVSALHKFKTDLDEWIYEYGRSSGAGDVMTNPTRSALQQLRDIVKDEIETSASRAAQQAGRPELYQQFQDTNRTFSSLATADEWAGKAASRQDAASAMPGVSTSAAAAAAGLAMSGKPGQAAGFAMSGLAGAGLKRSVAPRISSTVSSLAHGYLNPGPAGKVAGLGFDAAANLAQAGIRAGAIEAAEPSEPAWMTEYLRLRGQR